MARQSSLFPADARRRPSHVLCAVALLALLVDAGPAAAQVAGALDATFAGDGATSVPLASGSLKDEAFALAIDSSDRVLVAGYVNEPTNVPEVFAVVGLKDDGSLDPTFNGDGIATLAFGGAGVDAQARAMVIQPNGRIVLAGRVKPTNNQDFAVARLETNGLADSTFSGDGKLVTAFEGTRDDEARAVALTSDNRIVVAGYALVGSSNRDIAVARYESDGDLDPTFSGDGKLTLDFGAAGGNDEAAAVAVDGNDRILVAGYVADGGTRDLLVFRLTTGGVIDTTFNGGTGSRRISFGAGESSAAAIAIQPDGRILVAGSFEVGNVSSFAVARLLANGTLDASFGSAGLTTTPIGSTAKAYGLALHPSGRFTLGGAATVSGKRRYAAAQYRANGTLDPTFGTLGITTAAIAGIADEAQAIVQQSDGKIVLAGWTSPSGPQRDFGLVRLTYSDCGDGVLGGGEQCDNDDLGGVTCCSLACTFASAGTQCRAVGGVCDVAESCTGANATCPVDQFAGNGTPCRAVQGSCDVAESCTGSAAACPADLHLAPGTPCRASLGICDLAESCDGGAACPNDARVAAGTPCRAANDLCDAVETCNGSASICPADLPAAAGTVCRVSAGGCDAADTCDGATFSCPADLPATAGTPCRASAGACDVAESCDGASFACPTDQVLGAGEPCRAVADACDVAESCDGSGTACPLDQHLPDGDADGTCDVEDVCPLVSDPTQSDGDTDGLGDACDPCTNGVVIDKPVLRAESLLAPSGDDTFALKGELVFDPARPALDPLANGMRVQIQDGSGAVLFDAEVPAGAYDANTRVGWRRNVNRTLHRFRSPTAFGGLVNKVKMVTRTRTPALVDLKITGRNADFTSIASATGPLRAIVTLSPPGAPLGHCGERAFPGPAPEPACGYLTPGPEDTFEPNSIFECR